MEAAFGGREVYHWEQSLQARDWPAQITSVKLKRGFVKY
jgi:hypothetical protein